MLERRLVAELGALGFAAERLEAPPTFDRAQLERIAQERDVDVLVAMRSVERGLEVWLVDRITSKTLIRVLPFDGRDIRTTTLEVLEVLLASFLEIESRRFEAERPVPPVVEALVARERRPPGSGIVQSAPRHLVLRVAGAASFSPGGLPPGAHVDAELGARFALPFSGSAWLLAPTAPLAFTAPEGSASVSALAFGVGFHLHPLPRRSRFDVRVGIRAGALGIASEGTAAAPYRGQSTSTWTALVGGEARIAFWMLEWLAIDLGASALVAAPQPTLVFAGRTAASWAQPLVLLSLGLEATLF